MKTFTVEELLATLPPAPLPSGKQPTNEQEKAQAWAKAKAYFAKHDHQIVEDNQSLDNLIDAGARLYAHWKPAAEAPAVQSSLNFDCAVDAALEKFAAQLPSDSFGPDQLAEAETEIRRRLSDTKLDAANAILSRQHRRRKLTFADLGFIYSAHRKNVLKNPNGASPYSGLVALGESAAEQEIIDGGYDHRQIAMALTLLGAIGLTRCIEEPDKRLGRCGRWDILWHPKSAMDKPT